jgi:hypothetical protein
MADCKLIEIRDRLTFIPAMAVRIKLDPESVVSAAERWLLRRVGYPSRELDSRNGMVLVIRLTDNRIEYLPSAWGCATVGTAHEHIAEAWDVLESGDVVDVQFITGERDRPVQSERFE